MNIGYVAVEQFIPTQNYQDWCKLYHVKEVVSIDGCLCPSIFNYLEDEYNDRVIWFDNYIVTRDLEWLIELIADKAGYQILAVSKSPCFDSSCKFADERFGFMGYDMIDHHDDISALTNCGGLDKAFLPCDISIYGLIADFSKAKEIQQKLLEEYPEDDHADCVMWAIWRLEV